MTYTKDTIVFQPLPNSMGTDHTGQTFFRWTVLGFAERRQGSWRWWCECVCGTIAQVSSADLTSGHSRSCGCLRKEIMTAKQYKHGKAHTSTHNIWSKMKKRCYNPTEPVYPHYGGRGILVCNRWMESFENFLEDMGERPSKKHSLDRIDNDGHYEPNNCRWATQSEQMNNTRGNHHLTMNGVTHTVTEWSRIIGISAKTLFQRIYTHKDWSDERILTTPLKQP